MKKTLLLLLGTALLLSMMTGCSGEAPDVAGTYAATACYLDGEEGSLDGEYLVIENDGTGTFYMLDSGYDFDWELSGNNFYFEDEDGDRFAGTYDNGVIEGEYFGDYFYVFELGSPSVGKSSEKDDTGSVSPAAENTSADSASFTSGTIGEYEVAIVGAELITDMDGEEGIRFYYDFTNNSDDAVYPAEDLYFVVEQNGYEMVTTYCSYEDDAPEYGNDYLYIRPGMTIRCCAEYSCKVNSDPVTFTISDWWDEEVSISAVFDMENLPGRPSDDLVMPVLSDPDWTKALPTEGTFDDDYYVSIESAEVVTAWEEGAEVLRVYFDFTNNSDEDNSMWWATNVRAFQDGVELYSDWPEVDVEEDENWDLDIPSGESITCSQCFLLVSDSPVEIEVYDFSEGAVLGTVFEVE